MSKSNTVIEFKNVSKEFDLQNQKTFKEFLPALLRGSQTHKRFTALKDISFTINKGETVGFIGPNGSGKSTVLKLIAGVMSPTKGSTIVNGKVSPLIELGAGMHPELSGRENIYLNGSILGLTQTQIDQKINEIIDFSELHEFIDQPIKHYSSGMYMRLGFSIAVSVDPQILIVDEILAVGDSQFQQKCFEKIRDFQKDGKTIILVTHDLSSARSFCDKAIYIQNGLIKEIGKANTVIDRYIYQQTGKPITQKKEKAPVKENKVVTIKKIEFLNSKGVPSSNFLNNDQLTVSIHYKSLKDINDIAFGLAFYQDNGTHLYGTNSLLQDQKLKIKKGQGIVSFVVNDLPILQGKIYVTVATHSRAGKNYDWQEKQYSFLVHKTQAQAEGIVDFDARFIKP